MFKTYLPYIVAFVAASISVIGIRTAVGPERGARLAGVGAALGILAALFFVAGFSWTAAGPLNRIGHIVIGAVVVGTVLDALKPATPLRWILFTLFSLGCGWASAVNGLLPKIAPTGLQVGLALALALLWLGMIVRFSKPQAHQATTLVVVIAVGAGIAVLASLSGDSVLTSVALSVVAALFALAMCSLFASFELGNAVIVPVTASAVAMAWALAQRHPETLIGLAVLTLVLFAERTARRVPMPKGGIAAYLYLAVLAAFCAIPIVIAAVLVSAAARA